MPSFLQRPFVNYTQAKRILPPVLWWPLRLVFFVLLASVLASLWLEHAWASQFFWNIAIPLMPLVFLFVPGLWRNLCPLATINQMPRLLRLSFSSVVPRFLGQWSFAIAGLVFVVLVVSRPLLFEVTNFALLALLAAFAAAALLGGILFKGKSGWCGSFCPLAPIQKVYGQAPALVVPNAYCKPCVGCHKNCYDFNPRPALMEDLSDPNHRYAWHRHAFLGLLPGLLFGFFTYRGLVEESTALYLRSLLSAIALSGGIYFFLLAYLPLSAYRIGLLALCASLSIFYWFSLPAMFSAMQGLLALRAELVQDSGAFGGSLGLLLPVFTAGAEACAFVGAWGVEHLQAIRVFLLLLLLGWFAGSLLQERRFLSLTTKGQYVGVGSLTGLQKSLAAQDNSGFEVFEEQSNTLCLAKPDMPVLEAMEEKGLPIESGCRMGICGADPIVVLQGEENVEALGEEERNTLLRLGLLGKARMACMMKVCGRVEVSMNLSHAKAKKLSVDTGTSMTSSAFSLGRIDPDIRVPKTKAQDSNKDLRIIVVGNGVAGSSGVQFLRLLSPHCKVAQIAAEPYSFYNRMGLCRLIYGRSGLGALSLLDEGWYKKNNVDLWLNTFVSHLDIDQHRLVLRTGEELAYDRLLLALGSQAIMPPFANTAGVFTMRGVDQAMAMRRWVQERRAQKAVMVGGGLQGVEIALALKELGLQTTLVHRHAHLIDRQGDRISAEILRHFLTQNNIEVLLEEEITEVVGGEHGIQGVKMKNNPERETDLCVFSIGIRPQTQLVRDTDLIMDEGAIAVNANMQTSRQGVYAAGDCARWGRGTTSGLWGIGLEMGKVAAYNMLGHDKAIDLDIYNTPYILKIPNFNLFCFGRTRPLRSDRTYNRGAVKNAKWWQIVINEKNEIVGGIFVNHNEMAMEVRRALREKIDASTLLQAA